MDCLQEVFRLRGILPDMVYPPDLIILHHPLSDASLKHCEFLLIKYFWKKPHA